MPASESPGTVPAAAAAGHEPFDLVGALLVPAGGSTPPGPAGRAGHSGPATPAAAYSTLSGREQRMYRTLAHLPDRLDTAMAAVAAGLPQQETSDIIGALADARLLNGPRDPLSFELTPEAREHALALAGQDGEDDRQTVLRRLYEWMLLTALAARQRLALDQSTLQRRNPFLPTTTPVIGIPFSSDGRARYWLRRHQHHLLPAARGAAGLEWHDIAWRLVDAWPLFVADHPYRLWAEAHQVGLASAGKAGDPAAIRQMLLSGAAGLLGAGRTGEATQWYTQALRSARSRSDGDARDEGQALLGLAGCYLAAGEHDRAEDTAGRAITCWEECDYPRGVALARTLLGEIAISAAEQTCAPVGPAEARKALTGAYQALTSLGDDFNAFRALALHGYATALTGGYGAGQHELRTALNYFDQAGATRWCARGRALLAAVTSDTAEAQTLAGEAADLYGAFDPAEARRLRETFGIQEPQAATGAAAVPQPPAEGWAGTGSDTP